MQADTLSITWLLNQGYTVRQAAKAIKRSPGHVSRALKGERDIRPIVSLLRALPKRRLTLRERIAH